MYFKKSLSIVFVFIVTFTTNHAMELVKATIQEHAVPVAISMGIGAIGGATEAIMVNKMNEHYKVNARYNIAKRSALSALNTLPTYAGLRLGNFDQFDTISTYLLVTTSELECLTASFVVNYCTYNLKQEQKNNILINNQHLRQEHIMLLTDNIDDHNQNAQELAFNLSAYIRAYPKIK